MLCKRNSDRSWLKANSLVQALIFVFAFAAQGWALDHYPLDNRYIQTTFTVEDGLSSNVISAVLQGREGFLWVGTEEGLLRFDGRHFTAVHFSQRASGAVSVNALAEGPDGGLWIGGTEGLAEIPKEPGRQADDEPSALFLPGSGASNHIECLHFGRDGVLWVGTDAGLFRFQHGKFTTIIPGLMISRIEETSTGHLLVITSAGFMEWDGARLLRHEELPGRLGVQANEIFHVYEDRRGVLWYCTALGIARSRAGSIERLSPYGTREDSVFRAYEDASGAVWIAGMNDLLRVGDAGREIALPNLHAHYLTFDRDGELWVGTNGDGLIKFKNRAVRMLGAADGLPGGVTKAVLSASDGKLWVGSNCGGLSWFDGNRFHTYADADGLLNSCVLSLAEDRNKDILVGTYGGGVFRFRDGHFAQISQPFTQGVSIATALVPMRNGSLWIAYNDGLTLLDHGKARRFTTADGLSSDQIYAAFEDRQGNIWVETSAGIDRLVQDHFVAVAPLYHAIFSEDQGGNLFALAYRNGAYQLKEDHLLDLKDAPEVMGMATSSGQLWLCGAGIYRVPSQSLEAWVSESPSPRDYTLFDRKDGMNSADCTDGFRNMAITPDGKLWVATNQGLAMLSFSQTPPNNRATTIYMQRIVVEKRVEPPSHELVLAPDTHHLELDFGVIELASPEKVRFQYRMDGVDQDWSEPDASGSAVYNSLPIGTHKFHIRACNGDGIWDREGIVYEVTERAHYYETNLFRVIIVLVLSSMVALTFRFRFYQLRLDLTQRLNERATERARIARDLHDTLLQSFHGLLLSFQTVYDLLPTRAIEAKETLGSAIEEAAEAITEGRHAVEGLRSSTAETNDITEAVEAIGEELTTDGSNQSSTVFRVEVEGTPRTLHTILRDEIYRIAREALRNAFRHAQAKRIEVEIHYDDRQFRLRIRDDGKGIDPGLLNRGGRAGHFGLHGMRERAKLAGGELAVWSELDSGTEIELTIPASSAYATSSHRSWFAGKLMKRLFGRATDSSVTKIEP
jgi:signal transduction histidine kinase/ligand-binding sensor domain-containing protein